MVAIPAMLTRARAGPRARPPAQLHYLANPERVRAVRARSPTGPTRRRERCPTTTRSLDAAVARGRAAQRALPGRRGRAAALHRPAPRAGRFSDVGAALDRLGAQARQARAAARPCLPKARPSPVPRSRPRLGRRRRACATSLTLDSDTRLPPGPAARAGRRRRASAQPAAALRRRPAGSRAATRSCSRTSRRRCAAPEEVTLYHWLFAGQSGHRPVQRRRAPRSTRTCSARAPTPARACSTCRRCTPSSAAACPRSQVLSHDLLEGSIARCAAVTDVTVIEDAPFHADVAASRVHRWTRGDWQLLPFLLHAGR